MPADDAVYRGFVPRPLMPDIRLFHGYMARVPEIDVPDFEGLERSFAQPFVGITTDGTARPNLFTPGASGASVDGVTAAACAFLESLAYEDHRAAARQPLDSADRRRWTNAFTTWLPPGLLLADLSPELRLAAMRIVQASMSDAGLAEARKVMALNAALGDFVRLHKDTLGEWVYWFTIFGSPSQSKPWGWQLMGHHLVLNCLIVDQQLVLAPMFMGAEMAQIDDGPMAGMSALQSEHRCGPAFLHTLSDRQQDAAILHRSMRSADLPPELAGRVDGRHRAGAGRDNLVLPYAGLRCDALDRDQRDALTELIATYVGRVADQHASLQMELIERHLDETRFAWIGDPSASGAFYYRVHSPVILIEFDHHAGIFLTSEEPEPFHIHTIVRLPNGGDYGMAHLLRRRSEPRPVASLAAEA